jgi:hypothetical protein
MLERKQSKGKLSVVDDEKRLQFQSLEEIAEEKVV